MRALLDETMPRALVRLLGQDYLNLRIPSHVIPNEASASERS